MQDEKEKTIKCREDKQAKTKAGSRRLGLERRGTEGEDDGKTGWRTGGMGEVELRWSGVQMGCSDGW
jgi:hypothetical protein